MIGKAILKWLMMSINILVAIILLTTLSGSVISPDKFIFPAYFSLFFPFTIILNICFVFFWLLVRKWTFLLSLCLLLFSANRINDTFPIHFNKAKTEIATQPIRILTYNTMMCGKLKKHTTSNPNMVIQYILDSKADIVCLQEYTVSSKDEFLTHEDLLRIFSKYPYKHIQYKQIEKNKRSGVATFSMYPIVNKQQVKYLSRYNTSIFSDIKIHGKAIRLINNHLESNRLTEKDKDMPISLKDKFDAEHLTGITLHFSKKLGAAYKLRANQADAVAKVIETSPYKVIVCGDFNDVPASYAYTKVKGNLKDAFSETCNGFGWTFNDRYYHFRIDYLLYDQTAFSALTFKLDKVKYSDHYPVLCELNMKM